MIFRKLRNKILLVLVLFCRSRFEKFEVGICGYDTVFIIYQLYLGLIIQYYHEFLRIGSYTEHFDTKYVFIKQQFFFFFFESVI